MAAILVRPLITGTGQASVGVECTCRCQRQKVACGIAKLLMRSWWRRWLKSWTGKC